LPAGRLENLFLYFPVLPEMLIGIIRNCIYPVKEEYAKGNYGQYDVKRAYFV
jgi:hypothetical protein